MNKNGLFMTNLVMQEFHKKQVGQGQLVVSVISLVISLAISSEEQLEVVHDKHAVLTSNTRLLLLSKKLFLVSKNRFGYQKTWFARNVMVQARELELNQKLVKPAVAMARFVFNRAFSRFREPAQTVMEKVLLSKTRALHVMVLGWFVRIKPYRSKYRQA